MQALQSLRALRWQAAVLLLAGVAAVPLLYHVNPSTAGLFPPCPVRWLTGWLCPGCGALRALHRLLHGELVAAFALNPLLVVLLPLTAALLVAHGAALAGWRREWVLPAPLVWGLLWLTLGFTLLRNLPGWPRGLGAAAF
jgi:hypothetical protein